MYHALFNQLRTDGAGVWILDHGPGWRMVATHAALAIAAAAEEQGKRAGDVSRSVESLCELAADGARAVQESASSVAGLGDRARRQRAAMDRSAS